MGIRQPGQRGQQKGPKVLMIQADPHLEILNQPYGLGGML